MPWSEDQKIAYLLTLPWTIYDEPSPEGDRLLRVRELPAAIGTGETDQELEQDFWEALESVLRAYVHFGDEPPLPRDATLPWREPPHTSGAVQRSVIRVVNDQPEQIDEADTAAVERWKEPYKHMVPA